MISETNFANYEKNLHEINLDTLRQNDGVDCLFDYFEKRTAVNEIQQIGVLIGNNFKIEKKHEQTLGGHELCEVHAQEELSKTMTALNKQPAKADAEVSFVPAPAGQSVPTPRNLTSDH